MDPKPSIFGQSGYWEDRYLPVRPVCGPFSTTPRRSSGSSSTLRPKWPPPGTTPQKPPSAPPMPPPLESIVASAPQKDTWQNPAILQALAESKEFIDEISKKGKAWLGGRGNKEKDNDFSLRDWGVEFSKAEKIIRDLQAKPALADLLREAQIHMDAASKAHTISLFRQVELRLQVIEKICSYMELALYFDTLAETGICMEETGEKDLKEEMPVEDIRRGDASNDTFSSHQILLTLAICAHAARKFSTISVETSIIKDVKNRNTPLFYPVLRIGGRVYKRTDRQSLLAFKPEKINEHDADFLVIGAGSYERYVFSKEDLKPFALACREPKERFVMPNIIEEFDPDQVDFKVPHVSALLASSLGMTDLVYAFAEVFVKKYIRMLLQKQGFVEKILSDKEVKQKKTSRCIPLLESLRGDHYVFLGAHIIDGFARLKSVPLNSIISDVPDDIFSEKIMCSRKIARSIRDFPWGDREQQAKMLRNFSVFVTIGPWVFEVQIPAANDGSDKSFYEVQMFKMERNVNDSGPNGKLTITSGGSLHSHDPDHRDRNRPITTISTPTEIRPKASNPDSFHSRLFALQDELRQKGKLRWPK